MDKYWELTKTLTIRVNQETVNDFLLSLKLSHCSRGTVIQYRRFLERFFGDMNEPFFSISSETILHWFRDHQIHVKETTLQLRFSILSSFFTFCLKEELLKRSPMKSRWYPRLPHPVPKYLEKEEIAKTRQQSESISIRNQALIEFMLTSGCRVSEVHGLNLKDIDLPNRTAKVMGKGKKIRYVHFTDKCAVLFEEYLLIREKEATTSAFFVSSTTTKRLSIRMIQQLLNNVGEMANLPTKLHPHRLRHTFATELLAKGADLSFISDELGHSNLSTTQIYARLPKREIISLYRKYMG